MKFFLGFALWATLLCSPLIYQGCSANQWGDTTPDTTTTAKWEAYPYRVDITNEATVGARVVDSYSNKVIHVYGGMEGALTLIEGPSERYLFVEVGSYRFRTEGFWPNPVAPCWYLIVKQPSRRPDGPWPYAGGCP